MPDIDQLMQVKSSFLVDYLIFLGKWLCWSPACYGSSLGSYPNISQKYKMGDISKVASTLLSAK
jgi:hypothetical protein